MGKKATLSVVVGVVVVLSVFGWAAFHDSSAPVENTSGDINLSGSHLDAPLDKWSQSFSNAASVSSKGLVSTGSARLFSIKVVSNTTDTTQVRYFQLYNTATTSKGWQAGLTPVMSVQLPAATASASQVVNLGNDFFSPALRFSTGLVWAISTSDTTYASASTKLDKIRIQGTWNQSE